MTVFEELKARGLVAQCTNEEKVQDLRLLTALMLGISFNWLL